MDKQNPVLEVKNISKKYSLSGSNEPFWALKDISFELRQGEILGIIGKNGAGKSTLLKILSDVIAPSSGSVKFNGVVVSILDIGTGFHPDLSGYDNIFLNASLFGMSKKEVHEKLNDIIQFSGIESFIHEPVRNYSNGMYLRLAFSIAVHVNAQILLLDEVVAVGDNEFREKCMSRLRFMAQNGLTIVLVSHNMSQILELCSRAIWIDGGKVVIDRQPIDVIEDYIEGFSIKDENKNIDNQTSTVVVLNKLVNEFVFLERLSISSGSNEISQLLYVDEPVIINVQFEKLTQESATEIAIYITNLDGVRVFLDSFALRSDYKFDTITIPGKFEVSCIIPEDFLARGIYHISLLVSKSFELQEHLENVGTFKILPSKKSGGAENYFNQMNTVVSPRLNWSIKRR